MGEDRLNDRAHLLVGVLDDLARRRAHIAARQQHTQLAPLGLRPLALEQALLKDVQLGFRHGPLQPQQQSVVVGLRIIDPIGIADQRTEQPADLEQLIPVTRTARQARDFQPQHHADMIETHLQYQALKPRPAFRARPRTALVVVDDHHLRRRPAELNGPLGQGVLPSRRLPVVLDLLQRRLAHIDDRQALQMRGLNLAADRVAHRHSRRRETIVHRRTPLPIPSCSSVAVPIGSAAQ